MEEEFITTDVSLPEGEMPTDGAVADSPVSNDVDPVVQAISETTGKQFKTREEALKSVKDTFSYVGKKKEDIVKEVVQTPAVDTTKFVSREEFDEATFYAANPDYKSHKDLINALRKGTGQSLSEVVNREDFKSLYSKAKAHDEVESAKSVLQSNPRLGAVTDKFSQAKKANQEGNTGAAKHLAVSAVLDAME